MLPNRIELLRYGIHPTTKNFKFSIHQSTYIVVPKSNKLVHFVLLSEYSYNRRTQSNCRGQFFSFLFSSLFYFQSNQTSKSSIALTLKSSICLLTCSRIQLSTLPSRFNNHRIKFERRNTHSTRDNIQHLISSAIISANSSQFRVSESGESRAFVTID